MAATTIAAAIPVAGTDPKAQAGVFVSGGSGASPFTAIEVWGTVSAGGPVSARLLHWKGEANGGAGAWYRYGPSFTIDSAVDGGQFHARFGVEVGAHGYWLIYATGLTVTEAFMKAVRL